MNKLLASLLIALTTLMAVGAHAADSDNDGVLDSSDPCINSGAHDFAGKPKLKMKNLGTPGSGGFKLGAEFVTGKVFSALDVPVNGLRIVLTSSGNVTLSDIQVPGGAGWTNDSGAIAFADPLGVNNGIQKIQITDNSRKVANGVKIKIQAKNGNYAVSDYQVPVRVAVTVGDGQLGECGESQFIAGQCVLKKPTALSCKGGQKSILRTRLVSPPAAAPLNLRDQRTVAGPSSVEAMFFQSLSVTAYDFREGAAVQTGQFCDAQSQPYAADWSAWPILVSPPQQGVMVTYGEKLDVNALNSQSGESLDGLPNNAFVQQVGRFEIDILTVDTSPYSGVMYNDAFYGASYPHPIPNDDPFAAPSFESPFYAYPQWDDTYRYVPLDDLDRPLPPLLPWFQDALVGTMYEGATMPTTIMFVRNDWFEEPVLVVEENHWTRMNPYDPETDFTIFNSSKPLTDDQKTILRKFHAGQCWRTQVLTNLIIVPFSGFGGPVMVDFPSNEATESPNGINVFSANDFIADIDFDLSDILEAPYPDGGTGDVSPSSETIPFGDEVAKYPVRYQVDAATVPFGLEIRFLRRSVP